MPWLAPVMNRGSSPVSLAVAHLVWGGAFAGWYLVVAGHCGAGGIGGPSAPPRQPHHGRAEEAETRENRGAVQGQR